VIGLPVDYAICSKTILFVHSQNLGFIARYFLYDAYRRITDIHQLEIERHPIMSSVTGLMLSKTKKYLSLHWAVKKTTTKLLTCLRSLSGHNIQVRSFHVDLCLLTHPTLTASKTVKLHAWLHQSDKGRQHLSIFLI
jgi:hypothetical protein